MKFCNHFLNRKALVNNTKLDGMSGLRTAVKSANKNKVTYRTSHEEQTKNTVVFRWDTVALISYLS